MINCIFTLDYEIYGNGEGSLRELVHEPARHLAALFLKHVCRLVFFVEAAELELIEELGSDDAVSDVRKQVRECHRQGFEIGLHLHPQWYNARYQNGKWFLDYSEYNLCTLGCSRIIAMMRRSIDYLRNVLEEPDFTPLSFRAGNWLFQPTKTAAAILAAAGIKIDSSVFKGGLQRNHRLDYRPALRNGYYWRFQNDINQCDPRGALIEMPTHTVMVPFWKMLTAKRVRAQRKSSSSLNGTGQKVKRLLDYLRFQYPLKLDYCRMSPDELISLVERTLREDRRTPDIYRPLVAIGHTKDLYDLGAVDSFLSYLKKKNIAVTTFQEAYAKIGHGAERIAHRV